MCFRSPGLRRLAPAMAIRRRNKNFDLSREDEMKLIVGIYNLSFFCYVRISYLINNCYNVPIAFPLVSTEEKGDRIEQTIEASKNQARKRREQESGKMTRSQESCLAKVFLPLQTRFGLHGSCLKSKILLFRQESFA